MTPKRFNRVGGYVYDGDKCISHFEDVTHRDDIVKLLNKLHEENEQLKYNLSAHMVDLNNYKGKCSALEIENEQLKQLIKELEKQIYLIHMSSMFSTVKSFKGDVSKRYKYSEETDTIYDTANNYGQYDKVLDKKEIVMLLNEYETVLNELKGDVE